MNTTGNGPNTTGSYRKNKPGGYTLVEILIAMGMFTIFLGILFGVFLYGIRSWKAAQTKMDTSQAMIVALSDLSSELHQSSENSLKIVYYSSLMPLVQDKSDDPKAPYCTLSFMTPVDSSDVFQVDAVTRDPLYQAYIFYYVNPADNTLRKIRLDLTEEQLKHPEDYPKPFDGDLNALLDGRGKIVATNVDSIRFLDCSGITNETTIFVSNPLRISACIKVQTASDKQELLLMERIIRMYN